ncbi:hypothetical protein [Reyranella sp.]|uniref:hypothetical protein n=1 Tax=Reyranella sp. TaxID=1929291 RepID=UPI0037834F70
MWLPLADWSDGDVFAYLDGVVQRVGRYYAGRSNAPQCARCSAGWDQGRAKYLRAFYPELAADYERDMRALRNEIAKPLVDLQAELTDLSQPGTSH